MRTPEQIAYVSAKGRCTNPSNLAWKYYGARGIEFHFESFGQFFAELGPRPSPQHTLDRINNHGHYEPGNVRWATRSEQQRNTRMFRGPLAKRNPNPKRHHSERGRGHVYLQHGAWFLQFYQTENRDGGLVKVRRSVKLADKDREHNSATCKAVKALRDKELAKASTAPAITADDMRVVDYWEKRFLPYCEEILQTGPRTGQQRLKPSTLRGYKQVYRQHLKDHFGNITLQQYQPGMGSKLLHSLTAKQGWHVLKYIKAVGSAIFNLAVFPDEIITVNPWTSVRMPKDAVEPEDTPHYTREQSEDLVSALVDHVDAQLVLSLACFLALGPAEIRGLQWGDVDRDWIHIRRNVVLGKQGTTKTIERAASLPLLDEVRVPLELWRKQSKHTADGDWIIPDLHNLVGRVIKPHVKGERQCTRCKRIPKTSGVRWHGLYSARRGAITHAINVSGNIALGQRLARHASSATTSAFYHKAMPDSMFLDGMKRLNGKRD